MSEKTGPFQRSDRLRDSRDFRRIMRRGRRQSDQDLVVVATRRWEKDRDSKGLDDSKDASRKAGSRLGITASRKVGGAVVRNRFKRRVREWFRAHRHEFGDSRDLVVIARRSAAALSLKELDVSLSRLLGFSASRPEDGNPRG